VRSVTLLNRRKSVIHAIEVKGSKRGRDAGALEALVVQNAGLHRFLVPDW
jgi:hypothetical protein